MRTISTNHKLGTIKIVCCNVRSCNSNFNNLISELQSLNFNYDILVLTETWLNSNMENLFKIPNYDCISVNRPDCKKGGGIRVYFKDTMEVEKCDTISGIFDSHEALFLKFSVKDCITFILGSFYRPPNKSVRSFISYMENTLLTDTQIISNKCIFAGDFNININEGAILNNINCEFINLLNENSFDQHVHVPTRCSSTTGQPTTIIDHVWTNFNNIFQVNVINTPISDHLPISLTIQTKIPNISQVIKFRDYSASNYQRLDADKEVLFQNYSVNNDLSVDREFDRFSKWLTSILNKYFPIKTKKLTIKRLHMPWICDTTLKLINKRHRLFRLLKQKQITYPYFNAYSKLLKRLIELRKKHYFSEKFKNNSNDCKKTWGLINLIYGKGKKSKIHSIKLSNNDVSTNDTQIANEFNNYFSSIPTLTQAKLNPAIGDYDHLIPFNNRTMALHFTSTSEINTTIRQLQNKGNSLQMPVKFLKYLNNSISPLLSSLFNMAITQETYPTSLKIARVVPVYKAGDPKLVKNYRPISILPLFNKIFEKLIYKRLDNFITQCNILTCNQFGFRKNKDTQQASLKLIHSIISHLENKEVTGCVFLDFSKAFDTVDHSILLRKLYKYGVRGPSLNLLTSYLKGRKQYVNIRDKDSNVLACNTGVPQGSCLGPLLYIIYSNDLNYLFNNQNLITFADDTTAIESSPHPHLLGLKLNLTLAKIYDWCCYNKLSLNSNKTKLLLFGKKQTPVPDIYVNNQKIEVVKTTTYLGFKLNDKLTHKEHIAGLISKLKKFKYISKKISKYLTIESAKAFFYGMISSILAYGLLIWGGLIDTAKFIKLQSLQDSILFNLLSTQTDERAHVNRIYKRHKILKISDLYKINSCITVYKILNCGYLPFIYNQLQRLAYQHNYPTRRRYNFMRQIPRIQAIKFNFLYKSLKYYNETDLSLRNEPNVNVFKRKLIKHTLNNY